MVIAIPLHIRDVFRNYHMAKMRSKESDWKEKKKGSICKARRIEEFKRKSRQVPNPKLSYIYQYNCHIEHYLYAKFHSNQTNCWHFMDENAKKILMHFPFNSIL